MSTTKKKDRQIFKIMSKGKIITAKIIQIFKKQAKTGNEYLFLRLQGKKGDRNVVFVWNHIGRWGELAMNGTFYNFEIAKVEGNRSGSVSNLLNWKKVVKAPKVVKNEERELLEMRNNLFAKQEASGGHHNISEKLIWKWKPNTLNPTIEKLISQRIKDIQEQKKNFGESQ